ncbi:cation:proton antiporter [Rhizobium sp. J15]|uniref:cation:proton antiporter n=1 Tax=Rhizobium sp. J15 TaxID=2035450 RepID=UPI000BE9B0F0|nr:cation:proton antiporter [Rhizobium sp. J15]PDT15271.1 cation:proton antiporter [Rhizobium sp. J15]
MITPAAIIAAASSAALVILGLALLLTVWRVVVGPTLPDRILALDMLTGIAIGFIAVIAVKTGFSLYIDIAIALGLVGFLATVAFARFVLARGSIKSAPSPVAAKAGAKTRRAGRKRK